MNFLETSYGSLKETQYLLDFSHKMNFFSKENHKRLADTLDEIGAMLWTEIKSLSESLEN